MKIWARWPYIHLSVVFPSSTSRILCYATNTIKWKHSLFWRKSSTKHKGGQMIETVPKLDSTTAPHVEKVLWLGCHFWNIQSSAKDLDCGIYLFHRLRHHNVSHYIYYLATDNIHIVLENDNTVLIKGLKKVVNVKFSRNTHLIETSYDRLKSREITFQQYGKILLKQEFSDGLQISMNIKDIHYHDNSLLFTESIQNTHKSFHANPPTSGFFRVSTGALA